eukprot:TRINITY_DN5633_c0_g1_i1.p1 TRINITY_DN5633_c0_g1~~TRINITY_DN5633_c0_g1_i1.p1  ORF type:complete len:602 (+),score=106.04 TRINITY_DN5633_c0_g1_i1:106-1911(+)
MEGAVKGLVLTIKTKCEQRGVTVEDTLTSFVIKSVVLDERYAGKFPLDDELSEDQIIELSDICVDRLTRENSPALETIKMQMAFDKEYAHSGETMEQEQKNKSRESKILLKELLETRPRGGAAHEAFYRKIVTYIILKSEVGSSTDLPTVREVTAALESVFPPSELATFVALTKNEKEIELNELTLIVLGIRLFNRETGNGGLGIEDVQGRALKSGRELLREIAGHLDILDQRVNVYSQALKTDQELPKRINAELANSRQAQAYLQFLHDEAHNSVSRVEAAMKHSQERLAELSSLVKARTAVPTDQVYPRFIAAAQSFLSFFDEMLIVKTRKDVLDAVVPFSKSFELSLDINTSIEGKSPMPDEVHDDSNLDGELVTLESDPNFLDLPIELKGFCPLAVAERNGLLLPGDPRLGLVGIAGRYYAFSSAQSMNSFRENSEKFLSMVMAVAQNNPELIQLLGLESEFPSLTGNEMPTIRGQTKAEGTQFAITKPEGKEVGTQTPTHFIESNIDKSYFWNEWEMRRKALMLANLRTKRTHSSQTVESHYRRESATQDYALKQHSAQTGVEGGTQTAVPRRVIGGTRGGAGSSGVKVVNFEVNF